MNFTAAAACNDRLAPIGPAGEKSLHKSSDVRLWHICEKPPRPAWVRFWVLAGHLFARQLRRSLTQSDHYTAGWTKLPSTPVGECAVRSILGREPMQRGTGYEVGCNRTWANASALPCPAQSASFSVSGVTFSDKLGGFVLERVTGHGSVDDPFVVVERVTNPEGGTLLFRADPAFGNRIGSIDQIGFAWSRSWRT